MQPARLDLSLTQGTTFLDPLRLNGGNHPLAGQVVAAISIHEVQSFAW